MKIALKVQYKPRAEMKIIFRNTTVGYCSLHVVIGIIQVY